MANVRIAETKKRQKKTLRRPEQISPFVNKCHRSPYVCPLSFYVFFLLFCVGKMELLWSEYSIPYTHIEINFISGEKIDTFFMCHISIIRVYSLSSQSLHDDYFGISVSLNRIHRIYRGINSVVPLTYSRAYKAYIHNTDILDIRIYEMGLTDILLSIFHVIRFRS